MSVVAEFAAVLNRENPPEQSIAVPDTFHARLDQLGEIKAVIFDVYGTLVDYWHGGVEGPEYKARYLQSVFRRTAEYFGFTETLRTINPAMAPEKTLFDFYHNLIGMKHEEMHKKNRSFPEIQIEDIWGIILSILENNGYVRTGYIGDVSKEDAALCMAYYYNFFALGRGLFPYVTDALKGLEDKNIRVGILSNAQFYTPLDLTFFLRHQSDGRIMDINEVFDVDLSFFSYVYGVAKPSELLFDRLTSALHEVQIDPGEALFVGNDLELDIMAGAAAGLKTGLFTGRRESTYYHGREREVVPDITFSSYADLPDKVYFNRIS
ncbi:MAG: HAD family hydrolase [Fibrobacterota bacterium]